MWRCEETLLNHAVQKREKKKCNATQYGMWLYLGKGKCMYFTFMQRKKNTQRKHVNIKVLAWNKFCTQRAFRLFLSCTAVWPSGPLGRVPRVPRRAVTFKQWVGGVTCESMMRGVTTRMTVSEAGGGAWRTPASTPCERSMTGHVFSEPTRSPKKPFAHRQCAIVWCLGWAWETTWSTSRLPWRPSGAHSLWTPPPLPRPPSASSSLTSC